MPYLGMFFLLGFLITISAGGNLLFDTRPNNIPMYMRPMPLTNKQIRVNRLFLRAGITMMILAIIMLVILASTA